MNFDQEEFGQRIRGMRKYKGITQEKLSAELNISVEQLRKMECGTRATSLEGLISLAVYFGVSTDYILMGRDYKNLHSKRRIETVLEELQGIVDDWQEGQIDEQQDQKLKGNII